MGKPTRRERRQAAAAARGGSPAPLPPPELPDAPQPPPKASSGAARAPRPTGRPTKFGPETTKLVVDAILKGAGREDAAHAAGIAPSTFRTWMQQGFKGEEPFVSFLTAVEGAERDLVLRASGVLVDLLGSDLDSVKFASAKLILERRRPEVWGPRQQVRLEGPAGGPVAMEVAGKLEHTGEVAMRPLITRDELRELTRTENEAALALESERLEAQNREEEPAETGSGGTG